MMLLVSQPPKPCLDKHIYLIKNAIGAVSAIQSLRCLDNLYMVPVDYTDLD